MRGIFQFPNFKPYKNILIMLAFFWFHPIDLSQLNFNLPPAASTQLLGNFTPSETAKNDVWIFLLPSRGTATNDLAKWSTTVNTISTTLTGWKSSTGWKFLAWQDAQLVGGDLATGWNYGDQMFLRQPVVTTKYQNKIFVWPFHELTFIKQKVAQIRKKQKLLAPKMEAIVKPLLFFIFILCKVIAKYCCRKLWKGKHFLNVFLVIFLNPIPSQSI